MFGTTGSLLRQDIEDFLRQKVPREMSLCDLKARLPNLADDKERAEFIRDVIGMANAVRRIGRRGYLIYGIIEPSIVVDQSVAVVYPNTSAEDIYERMDKNGRHLRAAIDKHIAPHVDAELFFCEVQGPLDPEATSDRPIEELQGLNCGIVAWLEVRYVEQGPFVVEKGFEYEEIEDDKRVRKMLRPGSAWTRFGASKGVELRGDDQKVLVSYRDVPYVDNEYWKIYCQQRRPELPPFYQPVSGCAAVTDNQESEQDCDSALDYLRDWLDKAQTNLCLEGGIGSGKSTVLRQFHSYLLIRLQMTVEGRSLYEPLNEWIPVYVDVNGESFADTTAVADLVLNRLEDPGIPFDREAGVRSIEWRRKLLESPELHYVVMFDSLDEMDVSEVEWQKSLRSIRRFCESRRSWIRAILCARTGHYIWDEARLGWDRLELRPLRIEQVAESAKRLDYPSAFMQTVLDVPDLTRLTTNPLVMDTLLSFAVELEEESRRLGSTPHYEIGLLIHRVINAILEHESRKEIGQKRDIRRARRIAALEKLAWKLDGRDDLAPLEELEKIFKEEGLEEDEFLRAKQMGILKDSPSATEWGFTSDLVKAYFLARHAVRLAHSAIFQQPPRINWDVALKGSVTSAPIWQMTGNLLLSLPVRVEARRSLESFLHRVGFRAPAWPD